jgi:hypothetical protein
LPRSGNSALPTGRRRGEKLSPSLENAPILHINEQLGYVSIPGLLSFLKPA